VEKNTIIALQSSADLCQNKAFSSIICHYNCTLNDTVVCGTIIQDDTIVLIGINPPTSIILVASQEVGSPAIQVVAHRTRTLISNNPILCTLR